ncbi:helix-turn-helix domain-containing protein [Enterobacter sp. KE9933]|uniref:winged helix-turn-helix domain-containing protein n=1 Tax=Enterobacter sp. KE9933 TaxID=3118153 RepID=UPI0037537480
MALLMYGYDIGNVLHYRINESLIVNVNTGHHVRLRKTMGNLLSYLLAHAAEGVISDDDILLNVWDKNNLKASGARLWQVMNKLKRILRSLDADCDLIFRVEGKGYIVLENKLTPLWIYDKHNHVLKSVTA